ncbi:MAG: hypothetical protein N2V74_05680 [Candidatus Methanospirare jalkutatii]|nr:MAG: hypothetical protein N2V74_05680 [Candidatus Methanospirare jalkutatii]
MSKKKDAKLIYAQSSDIKARTYIEYRKDMKKKAIAELEIKEWLENKLKEELGRKDLVVEKYGGDRFLWFLREGGITREPDFIAYVGEKEKLFVEFQYADKEDLQYFDFKISKVAKKRRGERIPYDDRIFLYILKNSLRYAFIEPKWIVEHGEIGVVDAWGSRPAYRVPKEDFESILKRDESLKPFIETIDAKITILDFQHQLISIWEDELSKELQKVVDEEKLVKIIPKTLEGFFKICFILDHLDKIPENISLWLVYLLSYVNNKLTLRDIAMLTYSLDFLYAKIPPGQIKQNELGELEEKLGKLIKLIDSYYNNEEGLYRSSIKESLLEETRFALFSINLIEDIIQDAIHYHNADLNPIVKIYQHVKNPKKIAEVIRNENL